MEVSSWENHLFLWAIYSMAMLNNQRVTVNLPVQLIGLIGHSSARRRMDAQPTIPSGKLT